MLKLPSKHPPKISRLIYFIPISLLIIVAAFYLFKITSQKKQISDKKQFIGLVSSNLITSSQSLDEVVKSLDIVDSNYARATTTESNMLQADLSVVIGDNQKILSQIESIKNNLDFQKELINKAKTPEGYEDLKIDSINYYNQAELLLSNFIDDFKFENDILKVISINNSQNSVVKNDIWQKQDKEKIITYYKDLKNQAVSSLKELSKIKVSQKYQNYYNLQNSYFEFISATADEIINALQKDETLPPAQDEPSQIEKAYQIAFKAGDNIANIAKQITTERAKLLPLKINRPDFVNLASIQKPLESKIKILNQQLYKESQKKFPINF